MLTIKRPSQQTDRLLHSQQEVADRLGVSKSTIERAVDDGAIATVRFRGMVKITDAELKRLATEGTAQPAA